MKKSFKDFCMNEDVSFLSKIKIELDTMDPYEIDDFGNFLYDEVFYDDSEDDVEIDDVVDSDSETYELIDKSEIIDLLTDMDEEVLELIYNDLIYAEDDESDELTEKVSKKLHTNKKKRKFMGKSRTDLRKETTVRKRLNRMNKMDRKAYYKRNRVNILAYSRDYYKKLKAGKHFKKLRART